MNRKAFILAAMMVFMMVLLLIVAPASAGGAVQISGIALVPEEGECESPPPGASYDFSNVMTGDLEGCLYVIVESYKCSTGGVYNETGTEILVGKDVFGNEGTFETTYRFTAKFEECPFGGEQFFGRCQHPIIKDSGKDDFEGVRGRLDFKDDLSAGNFPYTGHLGW